MTLLFEQKKIPVQYSLEELEAFLHEHSTQFVCIYLAQKDEGEWERSTSRVYMNQLFENLLYVPVHIAKGDHETLSAVYAFAIGNPRVVAINQTQPHKSNSVCMELFSTDDEMQSIDTLVRNDAGSFSPLSLNASALLDWFTHHVTELDGKHVVLVGVGGVGKPIARLLSEYLIAHLYLVDPVDTSALAEELAHYQPTHYFSRLSAVPFDDIDDQLVVISAAGKEGAAPDTGMHDVLDRYKNTQQYFVDIRPQLNIDVVRDAKALGWHAYTGYHMNARNDYVLVKEICQRTGNVVPLFAQLAKLVAAAS